MLLWIICVLLYWRKVNREAEITLQPCPFQLIWTARLESVTLAPHKCSCHHLVCWLHNSWASWGARVPFSPHHSPALLPTKKISQEPGHTKLYSKRGRVPQTHLVYHLLWLRIFSCTVLAAADLLLWAQCGQKGVHSLLGKTGANFTHWILLCEL